MNRRLTSIIIILISFFLLFFLMWRFVSLNETSGKLIDNIRINEKEKWIFIPTQPSFYQEENFLVALNFARNVETKNNINAIIAPHDSVASRYLAALFKQASGRKIKKIIIIGPNHDNIGKAAIYSCQAEWQTPIGNIRTDDILTGKFLQDFNLKSQPEIFAKEHSIGAVVPYAKNYFPEASIVPIVLSSYADMKVVELVSQWLTKNIDTETLVVFSIDFSHYLTKEKAEQKDEITKQLMENYETNRIMRLNNDFVDSPASLATALETAKLKNWIEDFIYHSNSFDLVEPKPSSTTSHFGVVFKDK